jgi:CDP-diacylglycerol--serine O-phosphatidyltransferase
MHRFLNAANAVTLAGLGAALACALFAVEGRLGAALAALVVSGVCDLLDGLVARRSRRTEEEARFGARLDSLVDACAFGLAPAVLLYALGLRSAPELALIALFLACAVWRLAYFDTVGLSREAGAAYYTGLPVTFNALFLPLAALTRFVGAGTQRLTVGATALALAMAMVSPVRVPKPGGRWYPVLLLIAVGLAAIHAFR